MKLLRYFLAGQATSLPHYILEQLLFALFGWAPSLVGIGLRGLAYKLIIQSQGLPMIESGVRILQAKNIRLGRHVFIDHGVYLHACPSGITIGDRSVVMHNSILHVFNFRDLPHAGITLGRDCFIGEANVIRGQGGVSIGNDVYTGPLVQVLAVNHVYRDPDTPIRLQGITAQGITIEDDVWLAAGVIVLDGVRIGRGSVIGAGAVVTSDIPPDSIAVGSPAHVVKDRREAESVKRAAQASIHLGELEHLRAQDAKRN
ncbi:MAG TPA: acyltransferase [Anaerolineae bacterium]|nr:acyltransferase [Anaerolineae bacterium]